MSDFCADCGQELDEDDLRVPDLELFPAAELLDRCVECNARAGFADIWDVVYVEPGGDSLRRTVDVRPGLNTFEVMALLNRGGGMWRVWRLSKRKFDAAGGKNER